MTTEVRVDESLAEEARRAGRHRTTRQAVDAALRAYVRRRRQQRILRLFGTVEFDPRWDHKADRRSRSS
jgi:Arc/MetJ family transcription regulator